MPVFLWARFLPAAIWRWLARAYEALRHAWPYILGRAAASNGRPASASLLCWEPGRGAGRGGRVSDDARESDV